MLASTIRETIQRWAMISPGDRVLVGFSGGPDSVALLRALIELRDELECELCAAHLNHMLRGSAGDEDERWCEQTARSLGIPFASARIDVKAEAAELGGNLEEVARECRYRFLEESAEKRNADKIAVGHTRSDQAETVLLRLIRGAGSTGLRGMRYVRGRIIRPLLDVDRNDVMEYLERNKLSYRSDATNTDERFSRAFMRSRALPLLSKLNPAVAATVAAAARILGEEDDLLNELADGVLKSVSAEPENAGALNTEEFASLHPALQRRVLRRLVLKKTGSLRAIEFRLIEAMRRCALGQGPAVDLPGSWTARREGRHFRVSQTEDTEPLDYSYTVRPGQTLRVKEVDKSFCLRIIEASNGIDIQGLSGPTRVFLDADAVGDTLEVRSWRSGDRYRPLGAPGRQKIHDLFINAKVRRSQRYRMPVFVSRGNICWVSGLRIGDEFQVTPRTSSILDIEEVDNGQAQ